MPSLQEMMHTIRETLRAAIAARAGRRARVRSAGPALSARRPRTPRLLRTHPADKPLAAELQQWHGRLNRERFGGTLKTVAVRVSRRMRSRLGHYAPAQRGAGAEIAISARHLRQHGFEQALLTLLHEMVHQWQDESGLPLGHGADFRRKARDVGITARARRAVD